MATLLPCLFAISCIAGDGVFSRDGKRLYTVSFHEKTPALREINVSEATQRFVPLPQLGEQICGVAQSDDERLYCLGQKGLWLINPATGAGEKIITAPEGSRFWRVAYNPAMRAAFVTSDKDPLIMVKSAEDVTPVFVRRHAAIACLVFTADGDLLYCSNGDLWRGTIKTEEGQVWLDAERYAPLAWLETSNGTPAEIGVSDITVARDIIYVQLFRMGGSGWGLMGQLPRQKKAERSVSSMAEIAPLKIADYKEILQGFRSLGENDRDACLCASLDESRVYYTKEDKDYLITNGQTQELHLKEVGASDGGGTVESAPSPRSSQEPGMDGPSSVAQKQIAAMSARDLDTLASLYGEGVDYLDKGLVSNDAVRAELDHYFERWPVVKWQLAGAIQSKPAGGGNYEITFPVTFEVSNPATTKRISGSATQREVIAVDSGGNMKIIAQQEKITSSRDDQGSKQRREREKVYDGRRVIPAPPDAPWHPNISWP